MHDEHENTRNVFDQNVDQGPVDLVVYTGGQKKVVGKAFVSHDDSGIHINAHFDTEDQDILDAFTVGGYAVRDQDIPKGGLTPTPLGDHKHEPVNHIDGLQDWCDECGLTAGLLVPQPRRTLH